MGCCMKSRPKLLVIQENETQLSFLADFGYNVDFISRTNNIFKALTLFDSKPNLLILDLSFAFVIGSGFLEFLRRHNLYENIPIIVISDLRDKKDELCALRGGADDFIVRPFDVDILLARIDVSLRRSNWNKATFLNMASLPFLEMPDEISDLTVRETTILNLISRGESNDDIATKLCLSSLTVKTHVKNLFKKLGVCNRTEAILVGINFGLIDNS